MNQDFQATDIRIVRMENMNSSCGLQNRATPGNGQRGSDVWVPEEGHPG